MVIVVGLALWGCDLFIAPDGSSESTNGSGGTNSGTNGGATGDGASLQTSGINSADGPGAHVPEIGEPVSVVIINRSGIAADVHVRFLVGDVEVRRTDLHVPTGRTIDAIGPDLAARIEVNGLFVTGEETPKVTWLLTEDFMATDFLYYILTGPGGTTDDCPDDPGKTEPGVCGCGVPDTDSDGDGMPNCIDKCPNDLSKTAPGACGCGTSEADKDGDGTPDCIDKCPSDPNKTAPGACGCGTQDTDNDHNGVIDCHEEPQYQTPPPQPSDSDGDGIPDSQDNCPNTPNYDQADDDQDGVGNVCDQCPDIPDVPVDEDGCPLSSVGACCHGSGDEAACAVTDQVTCEQYQGHHWQGPDTDCTQCASGDDHFHNGSEGWRWADLARHGPFPIVLGGGTVDWHSSGGNSGGCISLTDPSVGAIFFKAPAAFLGDQSAAYDGGSLTYDMKVNAGAGSGWTMIPDLVLVGAGKSIVKRFGTVSVTPAWAHFDLPLTAGGWRYWDLANPASVTSADFQAVLSNLTALYLCADYILGFETVYLDNVALGN